MKKYKCLLCGAEFAVNNGEEPTCPMCYQTGATLQFLGEEEETKKGEIESSTMYKIGYGLYAITTKIGEKHNAAIVNSVMQVTSTPNRVTVTVNKANYTHDIFNETGICNLNILSEDAPFSVFESFGFRSGKDADKLADVDFETSVNGLAVLKENVNGFISLKVEQYVDLDTHGMFICEVTEAKNLSKKDTMTYSYYHKNVKPKPAKKDGGKKGFVCKICGYTYEGETLPEDFTCPLCKHPASDFEPIK